MCNKLFDIKHMWLSSTPPKFSGQMGAEGMDISCFCTE